MTDNDHPITPPLDLVQQWFLSAKAMPVDQWVTDVATQAARWGYTQRGAINEAELQKARDEELEAVIAWMMKMGFWGYDGKAIPALRAARRPKPKSQAEEALEALNEAVYMADDMSPEGITTDQAATIRAALERLRELEEGND